MTSSHSVVLAAPVRTAIGTFGSSLKDISAPDVGTASGRHIEDLVRDFEISRAAQDEWAVRSQQRFGAAQEAGMSHSRPSQCSCDATRSFKMSVHRHGFERHRGLR